MNRFQRQLEVAMQAINTLQDEHLMVLHELRDARAENRRLLFQHPNNPADRRHHDELVSAAAKSKSSMVREAAEFLGLPCVDLPMSRPVHVDLYFDVLDWKWVAFCDIEVQL